MFPSFARKKLVAIWACCHTLSVSLPSITGGVSTHVALMVRVVFCVSAKSGIVSSVIGTQIIARNHRTRSVCLHRLCPPLHLCPNLQYPDSSFIRSFQSGVSSLAPTSLLQRLLPPDPQRIAPPPTDESPRLLDGFHLRTFDLSPSR